MFLFPRSLVLRRSLVRAPCAPGYFTVNSLIISGFGIESKAGRIRQREPVLVERRHAGEDRLAGLHRRGLIFERGAGGAAALHVHVVPEVAAAVDRHVEGRGEAGNAHAIGDAAGDRDVRLQHVDRVVYQHVAVAEGEPFALPGMDRHARAPAHVGHQQHVVLHQRFLEEARRDRARSAAPAPSHGRGRAGTARRSRSRSRRRAPHAAP